MIQIFVNFSVMPFLITTFVAAFIRLHRLLLLCEHDKAGDGRSCDDQLLIGDRYLFTFGLHS